MGIRHVHGLDLRNHQRAGHRRRKTGVVGLARGVTYSRHHRRLLGGHRHQHVLAIDLHVGGNADRHVHCRHHVLDQLVGERHREIAEIAEMRPRRVIEIGKGSDQVQPLARRFTVETGNPRTAVGPRS